MTDPIGHLIGPTIYFEPGVKVDNLSPEGITIKYEQEGRDPVYINGSNIATLFVDGKNLLQDPNCLPIDPTTGIGIELVLAQNVRYVRHQKRTLRFKKPEDIGKKPSLQVIADEVDGVENREGALLWSYLYP